MHSALSVSVKWTFFTRCYGWGAMSEYWFNIGNFVPTGAGWPKISGRRGRSHQLFFYSENYVKWSFVWFKNLDISFFRFVTIHTFDRRTDGRTEFSSLDRVCIACSTVKIMQLAVVPSALAWTRPDSRLLHRQTDPDRLASMISLC